MSDLIRGYERPTHWLLDRLTLERCAILARGFGKSRMIQDRWRAAFVREAARNGITIESEEESDG